MHLKIFLYTNVQNLLKIEHCSIWYWWTYGLGRMVLLRLSFHCRSETRLASGTLGRQVKISDLPTGFRCTSCIGKISRRASPKAQLVSVKERREEDSTQLIAHLNSNSNSMDQNWRVVKTLLGDYSDSRPWNVHLLVIYSPLQVVFIAYQL